MKKLLFLIPLLLGCATEADTHKAMLPLNVAIGYISAVAVHEGGHALSAKIAGAESIKVTMWPTRDDNDHLHLGLTEAVHTEWSSIEERFFNISGPMANISTHIMTRELLKTGVIPHELQPTLQWISVSSAIALYGEAILGMARAPASDLGKEPVWISYAMFGGLLLHDIVDMFLMDEPIRYLKVLFGDDFYEIDEANPAWELISGPLKGGGWAGVLLKF